MTKVVIGLLIWLVGYIAGLVAMWFHKKRRERKPENILVPKIDIKHQIVRYRGRDYELADIIGDLSKIERPDPFDDSPEAAQIVRDFETSIEIAKISLMTIFKIYEVEYQPGTEEILK